MTGRSRRVAVTACLAVLVVGLTAGVMAGQTESGDGDGNRNESIGTLVNETHDENQELQQVSGTADQRLQHLGSGAVLGLGIGLVVGSVVSFQILRGRVR